ncbi:MAG: FecR domain-containing protein [Tannerellaceae bacterium]|nr:FecR domain-containing protein [Tannerellaceae bacterium]
MQPDRIYKILRRVVDGTLPEPHRETVFRWLIHRKDQTEKDRAIQQIWNETSTEADETLEYSLQTVRRRIQSLEQKQPAGFFFPSWLRYAAMILLPLITGLTVWYTVESKYAGAEMIECYVPNGQQQIIQLPDGSHMRVNAGTLVIYPNKFTGNKRTVYLAGEANFSVEKDRKKPFIVRTGGLNVQVLGTKFNVESYPGSGTVITTVEEGSVAVFKENDPTHRVTLQPDDQVIYLPGENRFITSVVDADDYAAWTQGELRFINKSLHEVIATLERRYDIRFRIDKEIESSDLYTMKFKLHETLEDALDVFCQIVGNVTYRKEGQTVRLFRERKEVTP